MNIQKDPRALFLRHIAALAPFRLFGNNVPPAPKVGNNALPAPKDSDDPRDIDSVTKLEGRPHIRLDRVIFKDGTRIQMNPHEIVILVGPNNAGKSATLDEISLFLEDRGAVKSNVVELAEFSFSGTQISDWIKSIGISDGSTSYSVPGIRLSLPLSNLEGFWSDRYKSGIKYLTPIMCISLSTEARLSATKPVTLPDYSREVSRHALHYLYEFDYLADKLDALFFKVYHKHIIVNKLGGSVVSMYVNGDQVTGHDKSIPHSGLHHKFNSLRHLHEQGDGMRAFVGIMATLLTVDRDLILLDEPEAFLHPPQATALGRMLAEETPVDRQMIIATHSIDFLRGILDQTKRPVRIVRLFRTADVTRVTELSPEKLKSVWADPLLRFSKVLDGLFHDGVVVCEGDADCHFYAAVHDALTKDGLRRDLAFVHGAGKSRIVTILRSLRAVGVATRAVVDFDVLSDIETIRLICETLGGTWADFERDYKIVKSAIEQLRPELSREDTKTAISTLLGKGRSKSLSDADVREIKHFLSKASAWSEAKRLGKHFIPNGDASVAYERLALGLRKIGFFIVEVGELEGFCRTVGKHGPAWLLGAFEFDLDTAPELNEAREFVRDLTANW